jgi:hypothetical protein
MSNAGETAARTQRFNDAVRAFTPPSPMRHAKLMPMKDGIIELRRKGASLRLIRELLATVDVAVGTDTIARFLAEVTGEPAPGRSSRRATRKRTTIGSTNGRHQAVGPAVAQHAMPVQTSSAPAHTDPPAERTRSRGPRVADPRNL